MINDGRSSNEEIKLDLARAYWILADLGLDDHTYTHLSSRSFEGDSFYVYPFGMRFEEVSPETLMKVTFAGEVIEGKEYQYNDTGYTIHGNIYRHRQDINSVFHFHSPEVVAVASMKEGMLPLSQWSLHFYGKMSYYDYDSLALATSQGDQLANDLGDNYNLLMRNHGAVTSGRTIFEAMFYSYHLLKACQAQCFALSMNRELILPAPELCEKAVYDLLTFEKNLGERDWHAWVRKAEKVRMVAKKPVLCQ